MIKEDHPKDKTLFDTAPIMTTTIDTLHLPTSQTAFTGSRWTESENAQAGPSTLPASTPPTFRTTAIPQEHLMPITDPSKLPPGSSDEVRELVGKGYTYIQNDPQ